MPEPRKLKTIMDARQLTPMNVAQQLGVSERTVFRWLQGIGPSGSTARRLAAIYGGQWTDYMPASR